MKKVRSLRLRTQMSLFPEVARCTPPTSSFGSRGCARPLRLKKSATLPLVSTVTGHGGPTITSHFSGTLHVGERIMSVNPLLAVLGVWLSTTVGDSVVSLAEV